MLRTPVCDKPAITPRSRHRLTQTRLKVETGEATAQFVDLVGLRLDAIQLLKRDLKFRYEARLCFFKVRHEIAISRWEWLVQTVFEAPEHESVDAFRTKPPDEGARLGHIAEGCATALKVEKTPVIA